MRRKSTIGCSVTIMKTGESYDDLAKGLEDICTEAKNLEALTIGEKVYRIQFFLGGDLQFLAVSKLLMPTMRVYGVNVRKF